MKLGTPGEGFSINPVIKVVAVPSSVPEINESLIEISASGRYQRPIRLFRAPGDDVDDSIDSVCSPDRAAGSSDDFNPFNVLKQRVFDLPVNAGERSEERRVGKEC